jgi:hypothetical protein
MSNALAKEIKDVCDCGVELIASQWDGTCRVCNTTYEAGEKIWYKPRVRGTDRAFTAHRRCYKTQLPNRFRRRMTEEEAELENPALQERVGLWASVMGGGAEAAEVELLRYEALCFQRRGSLKG